MTCNIDQDTVQHLTQVAGDVLAKQMTHKVKGKLNTAGQRQAKDVLQYLQAHGDITSSMWKWLNTNANYFNIPCLSEKAWTKMVINEDKIQVERKTIQQLDLDIVDLYGHIEKGQTEDALDLIAKVYKSTQSILSENAV